jgi:hypothetical protein
MVINVDIKPFFSNLRPEMWLPLGFPVREFEYMIDL